MITKVIGIGFTFDKGNSNANIGNADVDFTKAVEGTHKAIKVVDVVIKKDDGAIAICKMSLRQIHAAITRVDLPRLAGTKELPAERNETDIKGAKETISWLKAKMPVLKALMTSGKLYAEYSTEKGLTKTGEEAEYARIAGVYVNDEAIVANLAADNCSFEA